MAIEIEKKFLLKYLPKESLSNPVFISQGYLLNKKETVVRIRLADKKAFMTIKGLTTNSARKEYEYSLPYDDAKEMIDLFCKEGLVEKKRYKIAHKGFIWEIDQFSGNNTGLVVAEIELEHIDQLFEKPDWVGSEVTQDPRYYNSNLIQNPYSTWQL